MNDKQRCQYALFPSVVYALTQDAISLGKNEEEKELLFKIYQIATKVSFTYANNMKLVRRVARSLDKILKLFVDSRDGKYHIRKVMLALHGATQTALDENLIDNDSALVVQDALNLEGKLPMNEEDWIKLKQSADKKVDEIVKILKEV